MSKKGLNPEGPRGSRPDRDHGGDDAWNPKAGKRDDAGEFDPALAQQRRDAHQKQTGEQP